MQPPLQLSVMRAFLSKARHGRLDELMKVHARVLSAALWKLRCLANPFTRSPADRCSMRGWCQSTLLMNTEIPYSLSQPKTTTKRSSRFARTATSLQCALLT